MLGPADIQRASEEPGAVSHNPQPHPMPAAGFLGETSPIVSNLQDDHPDSLPQLDANAPGLAVLDGVGDPQKSQRSSGKPSSRLVRPRNHSRGRPMTRSMAGLT
jgi:hypothetical protein